MRSVLLDSAVAKTATGLAGVSFASILSPDITVAYIGVPFNVLVACCFGAYSGFAFGDSITERSRLWRLFVACVFMGCAWTGLIDSAVKHFTDWELTRGALAGMGAVIACLTRFFMPELIKRIGPFLDRIPFLGKKSGD